MWKAAPGALIVVVALMLAGAGQASAQGVSANCDVPGGRDGCSHWYRTPWVSLSWSWPAGGMVVRGCQTGLFSADTPIERRECVVRWTDGSGSTVDEDLAWIGIDQTPPAVSAAAARPPDYNGWFNHPVSVSFRGADATSGVQSCTKAGYGGPDAAGVVLGGSCRDVAGNVGGGSYTLNYDSSAPAAPDVTALPNNNRVRLSWAPPADAALIEIARVTGTGFPALLFRGAATSFTDRGLKNGKRSRYLVTSIDRAGNRAVDRASAVPTKSHLLSPADGARLGAPPLLIWEGRKRATYYNVQLYRGRHKVLTRWPRTKQLQLTQTWRFAGARRRLKQGNYTWFVFPGFGERSERRFGKLLGKSSFRIVG
jgi:hypothetical protein